MKRFTLLSLLLTLWSTTSLYAQKTAKAVYLDGTLTFYYDNETHEGITYDVTNSNSNQTWKEQSPNVTRIVFKNNFIDYSPTTLAGWFNGFSALSDIEGLQYLNTTNVNNMSEMFRYCESLETLDLSNFNTINVTSLYAMFDGCKSLQKLDFSSFDTRNVTNMAAMFSNCSSLQSCELTNFCTDNVSDINWMFCGCISLKAIDLSHFNTANVNNMSLLFYSCKALRYLDLTSFDTQKVDKMTKMFANCEKLTNIFTSNSFTVSNVRNSTDMFTGCSQLSGAINYTDSKVNANFANYTSGYFTYSCVTISILNDKGYATYSSPQDIQIGQGATAYFAIEDHGQIACQKTETIPAATGILLYGKPGSYVTFTPGTSGDLVPNELQPTTLADGSLASIPSTGFIFVLNGDKFMKYSGSAFKPNKAYFNLSNDPTNSNSGASMRINLNSIDHITTTSTDIPQSTMVYRPNGALTHSTTGITIVNGRIQFIK